MMLTYERKYSIPFFQKKKRKKNKILFLAARRPKLKENGVHASTNSTQKLKLMRRGGQFT